MSTTWWSAASASPRRRRRTSEPGGAGGPAQCNVGRRKRRRKRLPRPSTRRRLQERRDVPGGFGFHAGLLQKAEIPEPLDEAELPGAERCVVAVRQSARHAASIGQGVAGVSPIAVDVHLDVKSEERR